MSILKPTVGQLLDRLALLAIKIVRADADVVVEHFRAERDEIVEELLGRKAGASRFNRQAEELSGLHLKMWPLVERAEAGDETVSAVELHRLNRRRAELREEIDKLAGDYEGPEKV